MKYFTKFLCQFVSFFLVFAIGFLSCIGVVVGGVAFAYCNVSIDKLNEWGMGLDTSGIFDPKADVPVNSLTLETLLGEILGIKGNAGKYSLRDLIDRYGLVLPDEVAKYLPSDVILNTALETLISQDGLITVLKNTPLNYLLQFVPEGVISDEAKETMGNVSLYDIIFPEDEKYGSFLHGIQLGFFLGVKYEKNPDGTYTVKYADAQHPTLLELLAPIDLGLVLSLFTDPTAPESTPANVIYRSLGHIAYADLLYSFGLDISTIEIADNVLRGRSVGDLFRDDNGDGVFEFYAPGAFRDLYVGTILGTDGYIDGDTFVVNYADPDHPTILELIAPLSIGGLVSSLLDPDYGKKPLEVVFDTLGEIEFNHLFGTFLQLDKLGMEQALAGKKVKDLVTIDPDTGMPKLDVAGLFDGVFVGDFLNVKSIKNYTVDANGKKHWTYEVSPDDNSAPVAQLLAFINIGTIMDALVPADGNFDANKVIDATYNQIATLKFIDILHVFIPNTESITGLDKALGDKTISTVLSFNVETGEFEFHLPDVFKDIYLADFFAYPYHFDADGTFVLDCEIDHPLKLIAHISAYDFVNALFSGDIFRVLYDTFGRIRLDDIFGLVPNLIPARFTYLYKGWKIGDFVVYNGEKWSFETEAYMKALNVDRLAKDLKEEPNPVVIGFVAGLLAGRLAYLLFLNDIPFAEYVATTYNGSTLREAVDLVIDTEALRLDRLLEDVDLSRAFAKNEKSGEYEFFWYGLIENIAFDDLVYIAFDYEKNGVDAIFGDATVGDLFVCDKDGNYSFTPENVFEFIYLDDLLNFALSFAGKDLEGIGLGGLYESLPLASLVVDGDGKITFLPDALFLNLKEDGTAWTEFKAAVENPTELRSLVILGSFVFTVAVDYLLHRDDFRAIAFDDFISDYDIDSQPFADIFGGKKVGDLFADSLSDMPKSAIRFFGDVRLASVLALFGLDGNDAVNTIVSDTTFGDIVYVDAADKIRFDGFAVVENVRIADLVALTGYENEKLDKIIGDKRLGDLFHYDKDASPAFSFTPIKLLGDIAFRDVAEIFITVEDGTALAEILDALGTVSDLVNCDEDGKYHFTPIEWIADIRFTALIEVTKVQELIDRDLSVIFHDKTIGDVLFYENEELRFEWFEIFRDISFNDLIGLIGLSENIETPLCRLFTETDGTDKTIGSLLSFERGTGLKVTWYSFVDDMHVLSEVVHIIGYENEDLERLLRNITVGSIISYDEETGKVSVNEIDYIALADLFDLILGFLGTSLAEKGIADLFDGLSVASVLTFTDGFSFSLDALEKRLDRADLSGIASDPTSVRSLTVAGILLAWVLTGYFLDAETFRANAFDDYLAQFEIGSAHGHGKHEDYIANLFAGKTFGDLLPEDLADFPTALVRFFGDMSFYTPFGALKIENEHLHNLLDAFYFHNIIFVNDSGEIDFHLENLDRILFSEILLLVGIDNPTLLSIVKGMSLGGLISYNYNEKKFEFTPLGLIADVRLNAFFGFLTLDEGKRAILDRMFDTRIGEILYKNEGGEIVFKPFAMTDKIVMTDILAVAGIEKNGNEDLYDLLDGKTLRDVITSDDKTLKDVSVTLFETLFGYEVYSVLNVVAPLSDPDAWESLLGHRRFSDLFSFTGLFKDFKVTFDKFFGTMKFVDIIYAATGIEGENVKAVFGDNTIGTVLRISPEFSVEFTPFKLTDTISLNAILTLVGYENEKLTDLLEGITLADIVTSEDGTVNDIKVNVIDTLLAFKVAKVIGLFYENDALNTLLGERRFDDLVKVTGLFEDVTVTFDDFFGTMALRDIVSVFAADAVADGKPLAKILDAKTIGTFLSVSPEFDVKFTPFRLTDDVALTDLLALAGIEDEKVNNLLEGITLADIVTSEDGTVNDIKVNVIDTLLAFKVAKVIGLFYENDALNTLLGERRFDDLVKVTGLFEDVTVTFDDFFGTMALRDIVSVFAADAVADGKPLAKILDAKTIGTFLSVSPKFDVKFTPFRLTDDVALTDLLALAGIEDEKVNNLLEGITLADIVTSEDGTVNDIKVNAVQTLLAFKVASVIGLFYENEALSDLLGDRRFDDLVKVTGLFEDVTVTFDDFFGTMKFVDILYAVTGMEGENVKAVFGDNTIGTVLRISPEFSVEFTPFKLTDTISLNAILTLVGIEDEKLTDLLEGITIANIVTSEKGGFEGIEINVIDTLLAFKVAKVIGLFYENEALSDLLGDRRFDDLVKVTGLFDDVTVTFDDFFGTMALRDIVAVFAADAVADGKPLAKILDDTCIGDILSISPTFAVKFSPFALTDDVLLTDLLALFGITEGKLVDLLSGIRGCDLVTMEDGELTVNAIGTLLAFRVISVIGLFYEEENLTKLLGDRRFDDLIKVTGLFENVEITWYDFVCDMMIADILRACYIDRVATTVDLDELFGVKTVGDLLAQDEDGANLRLTLRRFFEDEKIIGFGAILDAVILDPEAPYPKALYNLLGHKYIADLLSFDDDNNLTFTWDTFIADMALLEFARMTGADSDGEYIQELLGGKTLGTLLGKNADGTVRFSPFKVTDNMKIVTILTMLGVAEDSKLSALLGGITLSDIVTSENGGFEGIEINAIGTLLSFKVARVVELFYENEKLSALLGQRRFNDLVKVTGLFEDITVTFDDFFGTMRLLDILAVAGLEGPNYKALFGGKTIGTVLSISPDFVVTFTPFDLTDDMKINVLLDLAGIESEKLHALFSGLTLRNIVTSEYGDLNNIEINAIDTVFGLSLVKLIGLFYESEPLTRLLTDAEGHDKSLGTLVKVTGLFESVDFDIDAFVGNMALRDFVALTGYKNEKLEALIGNSTIGDYYSFNDRQLQKIDFVTLDAVADFVLSFFGTDLYTLGLDGIIDGVKVSDIAVVAEDGSVSFTAQPILDKIDIDKEWQSINENPMSLRSMLFLAAGTVAFFYLWLFDRDVILDLAFIPDLLGETDDADMIAIFGGKTVRDLVGDGEIFSLYIHVTNFFIGVPLRSIAAVLGLRGQYIESLLGDVTFDDVLCIDERTDDFHFRPFALTDGMRLTDILGLCGIENEKLNALLDGLTMEDIVTSPHKTVYNIRINAIETLLSLRVAGVTELFYENEKLSALLGDRRFSDLVNVTGLFEKVEITFDDFFGDMKFTDILAVAGAEGSYLNELFGDSTIGTVLSITPEFKVTFTPFLLTDDMRINTILAVFGIRDNRLTDLLDGITLSGFVTSDDGSLASIRINAIDTLLSLSVAKTIGLFYENANLRALLGTRRFSDLVKVNGLFESVSITFDDFFGAMALRDIAAVFVPDMTAEGQPLAAILGTTRVGDVISVPSDFRVKLSPCALTDNVLLTDVLALFGQREGKIVTLLEGIRGRNLVTIEDGNLVVGAIDTVLHFAVADVIGLFYENEKLNTLLGDKQFADLVQVYGLFENVSFTFNAFFGDMQWTEIFAVFGLEGLEINELFGESTIGTVISVDSNYNLVLTPFLLTDGMCVNTLLSIAGITDEKIKGLLAGITLGDIVTSPDGSIFGITFPVIQTLLSFRVAEVIGLFYENEKLNALLGERRFDDLVEVVGLFDEVYVTFDRFFGDMKFVDILAVAGTEDEHLNTLLDGKTISTLVTVSPEFVVTFTPFAVTNDMELNVFLAMAGIEGSKLNEFLEGITLGDLVTSPDGTTDQIEITAIDTILSFEVAEVIGLFYEEENLMKLLGDRRFSNLIKVTGLFESVEITWYDFVCDMMIADILRACYIDRVATTVDLDELFGVKTVGDLLAQDEDGANIRLTLRRFFEDEKIIGFGAILDAVGLDPEASYTKALYNLLGHKYIADLLSFDDDNNLTFTWDTFIADMAMLEFIRMAGLDAEGDYIKELLDGKTLGTLVGKNEDGTFRFSPFKVTDDMRINTFLMMAGIKDSKLNALVAGLTLSDIATSEDGTLGTVTLNAINTLLAFRVAEVIGLFYENEKLNTLLGTRRFDTLIHVTGLFENVEITFDDFFGTMPITGILAVFGIEGEYITDLFTTTETGARNRVRGRALICSKTVGDLVKISPDFVVTFTPFAITDSMKIDTFLMMAGIRDTKLNELVAGLTLRDIVTSKDGDLNNIEINVIDTIFDLSLAKLIGLFYENAALTRLLTDTEGNDKSLGTLMQVKGLFESVNFDIDAFVGNMALSDIVALTGYENEKLNDLLGDSTIGSYYSFNDKQLQSIDFITLDGIVNFALSFAGTDLAALGLDGIIDGVKVSQVVTVAEDGSVGFTAQPILDNIDFGREIEAITKNPTAVRSIVFAVTGAAVLTILWFTDRDVLLDMAFIPDLLGETEDANLRAIFEGKTVRDLLGEGFGRLHINAVKFLAGVKLSVIPGLAKFDNEYLNSMLGDTTFDRVISVDEADQFHFKPFALTDPMHLTDILGLCGIENEKVNTLLADVTLEKIVTSPHKTVYGVRVDAVQTLLGLRVADAIAVFYENGKLSKLLGDRCFDDLVKVTGLFEKVEVTFDDFFGSMKFVDILAVANAEGTYTDELFGNKTIGTVLSITPEFKVTFTPFLLTNDMRLNTILAIAGLKDDKITALFGDVTLSGIITSDNGDLNGVKFPVVQTLLSREVAKVIGLFYENENLNALLANRRFDDLVKVTGLFESVSITFDDFFGAMALRDIVAVFAADKVAEGQPLASILGTTRVGDVISVPSDFRVKLSPCALTDNVLLTDVLALFGQREGKIVTLLEGIRGRNLVTIEDGNLVVGAIGTVLHFAVADVIGLFYENGKLNDLLGEKRFEDLVQVHGLFENVSFTFNAFFGDMQWTKIFALFGPESVEINELFGEKTIGTLLSVNEQYLISFTPYALTDDMHINTFLAMAGVHNEKLETLLEKVTLGSIVTSDSKGVHDTRFTVIDTVFSFRLKDIVDLTGISHQLVDALCTEKTFGSFLSFENGKFGFSFAGLFGDVNVNAVIDGLLSFIGRSLAGWDMVYLFDGYVVTDLINVSDGKLYQGFDKVKDRVIDNKDKILDTIKSSPFSEPSLIYIGAGVVALTVIMATDRSIIMDADIAKTLGFAEDTYLYRLFTGKTLSALINFSGSDFNSVFTWYNFVSDMELANILGALRITDERVLKLVGTKKVGKLVQPDGEGSYKLTIVEFLGDTLVREIFGEEGYLGLFSDLYLVDLYDLAKGSRDLFTIVSMRMGNRSLYDLAKIVLGRDHERVRIVLGDLKVNSVLIADPDGGYNISFAAVKKIPFGSLFGYTKSTETGKWHDQNGKRVTGVMAAIADMTYSTFDTGIGKIRICEILGYTKGEDNKWYDENGVEVNGLITAFADLSIDDMSDNTKLNDAVNDLTVQQVLGLKQNENGKWTKDGSEVSPVIAALATAKIGNLEDKINKVELGEVAGFIKGEDGNYYEEDTEGNLKPASGVLGEMATLTIEAMKDSNQIVERLQKVRVGYALGYDPVDPSDLDNTQWTDGSGAIVSGILATVVNSRIADIDTAINNAAVGALLGYTETDGVWSKDGKAADGYLSLIGPGTKISELDARVTGLKDNATIGQFMDANLLQFDEVVQGKLSVAYGYSHGSSTPDDGWKNLNLNAFIGWMISRL